MTTAYLTLPRLRDDSMDRVVQSIERVQNRVRRMSVTLEQGLLVYAVIGGNAVAYQVLDRFEPSLFEDTYSPGVPES